MKVIAKHGTIDEINRKSREARALPNLMKRLRDMKSPFVQDFDWLIAQKDKGAFMSVADYRRKVLGDAAATMKFKKANAVTLEISAFQYFPWLIAEAKQAIAKRELMPGRFIRVRYMKESEADQGDLLAGMAAMQAIGASYVDTLDTKGTDGSNVHLGERTRSPAISAASASRTSTRSSGSMSFCTLHALRHLPGFEHQRRHDSHRRSDSPLGHRQRVQDFGVRRQRQSVFYLVDADDGEIVCASGWHDAAHRFNLSNSVNNATIEAAAEFARRTALRMSSASSITSPNVTNRLCVSRTTAARN